jgi:hypothetical protein
MIKSFTDTLISSERKIIILKLVFIIKQPLRFQTCKQVSPLANSDESTTDFCLLAQSRCP